MEIVGRSGALRDLEVNVLGCQVLPSMQVLSVVSVAVDVLQEPLDMASGVLRPSSIEAMWEQQNQTRLSQPFCFAAHEVLVDHELSWIVKVTKLCLPHAEVLRTLKRVAILIGHRTYFVQVCVQHLESARAWSLLNVVS